MPREREGYKPVNWWLPDEVIDQLNDYRHYHRLATLTEAATELLQDALRRWQADPDEMPLGEERPTWRAEAEVWRDELLTRFAAEMQQDNPDYVIRTVEAKSPFVSVLVRPKWAKAHFDLRAVADLRQNGLVELRVEARFAGMPAGSDRRQRAERDVDSLLTPDRGMPAFEPKPGQTQFKRQRLLWEPTPFADKPGDDWIIQEFGRHINALDQCLMPAVQRYYA